MKKLIGIDEVGRGCIAGPVVACACYFDLAQTAVQDILSMIKLEGGLYRDSKKLSAKKREEIASLAKNNGLVFHIAEVSADVVDEINILNATLLAMQKAYEGLGINAAVLVDGNTAPSVPNVECVIGGDTKVAQISLASILAKVYRDNLMSELGLLHPQYLWQQNKGYGTKAHMEAIKQFGISPLHRKTFLS